MGIVNIIVPVQHLLLIHRCYSEIAAAQCLSWHILEKEKTLDMNIHQIFKSDLTGYKSSGCTDHRNLIHDLPRRLLGSAENKTWYKQA